MGELAIGQLAANAGVTPEAIRYYERIGVLRAPHRNQQGQRRYAAAILDELRLLKAAQTAGFTLSEIAQLLDLTRESPVPCEDICGLFEQQIARIDDHLRELTGARARLTDALEACAPSRTCIAADRLVGGPSVPQPQP